MKIFKIILSVLALVVSAAAGILTSGQPVQVSPQTLSLVAALAGAFSILGISPFQLAASITPSLSAIALIMSAIVGWHASVVTAATNPHPIIWAIFAFCAAVVGVMGKSPIQHPVSAAAALDGPQPKG